MKKLLLPCLSILLFVTGVAAKDLIPLTVSYSGQPISHGNPKSPMQPPTVYIDGYTLLFADDHPEYVLNIKDEDSDVVFSTVVYSSQTQVILPSTLSGEYELQLIRGQFIFYGFIEL